jgi:hypothetical protein
VIDPDELTACTGCGAVTTVYAAGTHRAWHELNGHRFNSAPAPGDDAPTTRLPPIGETVRRRPPVPPAVRELKGPELLRALADELDRDGLSIADLDDPLPCGATQTRGDGVEWVCGRETGHEGPHEVHGRRW